MCSLLNIHGNGLRKINRILFSFQMKVFKIKLWIIYNNGIGFSKIVSEMLQERLEDYIEVFVGNSENNSPLSLIEEKLDFLIIGDVIRKENFDVEIQNWISTFLDISNKMGQYIKAISGFYVQTSISNNIPSWVEFLQKNLKTTKLYPQIANLRLNISNFTLENDVSNILNKYSKMYIDYILDY